MKKLEVNLVKVRSLHVFREYFCRNFSFAGGSNHCFIISLDYVANMNQMVSGLGISNVSHREKDMALFENQPFFETVNFDLDTIIGSKKSVAVQMGKVIFA